MGTSPNPGMFKTLVASVACAAYSILAHADADGEVKPAGASTDALFGVSQQLGAAAGERIDVCLGGLPEVRIGGVVEIGDPLTADDQGRAVRAAPAAGAHGRIIGFALMDAVEGDIVPFQFAPGVITGAAA